MELVLSRGFEPQSPIGKIGVLELRTVLASRRREHCKNSPTLSCEMLSQFLSWRHDSFRKELAVAREVPEACSKLLRGKVH